MNRRSLAKSVDTSVLTSEEQAMLKELTEEHAIYIPSRASPLMSDSLWEKRQILKRLVYKNRICFDFSVAEPNSEQDETCLVFFLPFHGKTPIECLSKGRGRAAPAKA